MVTTSVKVMSASEPSSMASRFRTLSATARRSVRPLGISKATVRDSVSTVSTVTRAVTVSLKETPARGTAWT
jgi:hypothetical protein